MARKRPVSENPAVRMMTAKAAREAEMCQRRSDARILVARIKRATQEGQNAAVAWWLADCIEAML